MPEVSVFAFHFAKTDTTQKSGRPTQSQFWPIE